MHPKQRILSNFQHNIQQTTYSPIFKVIEQFTSTMYDRNTLLWKFNDLRMDLSPHKVQLMETLPPTQAAFLTHVHWSVYQASIWQRSISYQEHSQIRHICMLDKEGESLDRRQYGQHYQVH